MFTAVKSKFLGKVALVAAAAFALAACGEMLSRDDFTARVKDKSDAEVVKLVGKPSAVDSSAADKVTWTYSSKTFNIQAGNKFDSKTVVVFSKAPADGKLKATDVVFE